MTSQILNEVTDKVINLGFSKSQDDEKKQESRGTLLNTERLEIPWPNAMLDSWLYPGIYIQKKKRKNPGNSYKRHFWDNWEHLNIDCILNEFIE